MRYIQTYFIFRLIVILLFSTGMICIFAIFIGRFYTTELIVFEPYFNTDEINHLTIIDINRNSPIHLEFPVNGSVSQVWSSPDGRRVLFNDSLIWDILNGEILYLNDYAECDFLYPRWASSIQIFFNCLGREGYYLLNLETKETRPILSPYYNKSSPNGYYSARNINNLVTIFDVNDNNVFQITHPITWQQLIEWDSDESILLQNLDSIQRYNLSTNSLETILEDLDIKYALISPNKEWLAIVTQEYSRVYGFHLETKMLYTFSDINNQIEYTYSIRWSPNNKWLLIQAIDNNSRKAHFALNIETSQTQLLTTEPTLLTEPTFLGWSEDSHWILYQDYSSNSMYIWNWDSEQSEFVLFRFIEGDFIIRGWSLHGNYLIFLYESYYQDNFIRSLAYLNLEDNKIYTLTNKQTQVLGFSVIK